MVHFAFVEIEERIKGTGNGIGGIVSNAAEVPVVFDELEDGRLICDRVIYVVSFGVRRDHEERQSGTRATAALIGGGGAITTGAGSGESIVA